MGLVCTSASLYYYTIKTLGSETWDIPTPLLVKPPPMAGTKEAASVAAPPPPAIASRAALPLTGGTFSPPSAATAAKTSA